MLARCTPPVAALAVALLSACPVPPGAPIDRPDPPDAGPESPFTESQAWGPEGTPLPAGAELVELDVFLEAAAEEDAFFIITEEEQASSITEQDLALEDARALVDALADSDPALAHLQIGRAHV